VYDEMAGRAHSVVVNRHAAVADAVFHRSEDRQLVERMARNAAVPFIGLWLDAPDAVLTERVAGRHADASDATQEVIRTQEREDSGTVTWHRIDATQPFDRVVADARRIAEAVLKPGTPDDIRSGAST
jgi:predicted kinase